MSPPIAIVPKTGEIFINVSIGPLSIGTATHFLGFSCIIPGIDEVGPVFLRIVDHVGMLLPAYLSLWYIASSEIDFRHTTILVYHMKRRESMPS